MKKIVPILLAALLLTACGKKTGWQDDRTHYDSEGNQSLGWFTEESKTYYLNPDNNGILFTGWLELDGSRYFFDEDGTMRTGWQTIDGVRHYFQPDGKLGNGWVEIENARLYLTKDGQINTGWVMIDGQNHYFDSNGVLQTGITEIDGKTYYLDESGCIQTGWLITEDGRYYLDDEGCISSGWMETEENLYYFLEDGRAAVGRHEIEGKTYYFTSTGANILLINRWNPLPDDYQVDLTYCLYGCAVDRKCVDALNQMLLDCKAAGCSPNVISGYRSYWDQQSILNDKIAEFDSYLKAIKVVAIPGTSEHHLGLAVDITDIVNQKLNIGQANNRTQQWLMQNCWDYGFILRYPDNTTDYTGIIYEPWHYRYVGLELSQELKELGICLEEYLDNLTGEGPSCGGIGKED